MAMAGIKTKVPFDQVVSAMNNIAKHMSPKFRETALGSLAITKTGNEVKRKLGLKVTEEI